MSRNTPRGPQRREIRIPLPLLLAGHHSPLAVAAYGLLDVLARAQRTGRDDGTVTEAAVPVEWGRRGLAERLGCTESGLSKALAALSREHGATARRPVPAPAYLRTQQRGNGRTAHRYPLPGVPYARVPEWTLGSRDGGPLVSHRVWRLVAVLHHRARADKGGTVRMSVAELAADARVDPDGVASMLRDAEAAGLIVVGRRNGLKLLILPLSSPLDADDLDRVREDLNRALAGADPAPVPGSEPPPVSGTAPPPVSGSAPPPVLGTALPYRENPLYGDLNYEDPAPEVAPLTARGPAPAPLVTPERAVRVLDAFAGGEPWMAEMTARLTADGFDPVRVVEAVAEAAYVRYRAGQRLGALGLRAAWDWRASRRRSYARDRVAA